jgi:uncharacterized protein
MSILVAVLLFALLFMVFVSLLLMVIGPVMLLQPQRRMLEFYRRTTTFLHPSDRGLPFEDITLRSAEGIRLSCWLIPAGDDARGTVIFLHGVSESKIVGLQPAQWLHEQGYHVFLYDSRRHGDSGGTFCTYGFYEKHDTSTIISYLQSRSDLRLGRIGLYGSSMGAAVALQVAARDRRVTAVIADSGFATLRSIFDDYQKRLIKLPWHYLRNLVIIRSERMAHFKANAVSPLEAVKDIHVPLLIIHGTADNLIDARYSVSVYEAANEPKELWLIQGARHNDIIEVGGEEYKRKVVEFFDRTIGTASAG